MLRTECQDPNAAFMKTILQQADEVYVALDTHKCPYVISCYFTMINGAIYIDRTAKGAHVDFIANDRQISFTAHTTDVSMVYENQNIKPSSVCGTGHACLVEDVVEKKHIMHALSQKYPRLYSKPTTPSYMEEHKIIRIDIETFIQ